MLLAHGNQLAQAIFNPTFQVIHGLDDVLREVSSLGRIGLFCRSPKCVNGCRNGVTQQRRMK
jgi:hypothetical protein